MRSFNGGFPPWRCSGRQRRRGERRRHPLGNKPWKKELHHKDEPWIRKLGMLGRGICLRNEEEGEFVSPRWEGNKELRNNQELGFVRL